MGRSKLLKCALLTLLVLTAVNYLYVTSRMHQSPAQPYNQLNSSFNTTLHIGVLVTSHTSCRNVPLLVKSIMMYGHNPIHFHFITNSTFKTILETLIDTWELPSVNSSFYPLDELVRQTTETSTSTDSLKLSISLVLPHYVSEIVLFEANVVVLTDVRGLWRNFELIRSEGRMIGLPENPLSGETDSRILLFNITAIRQIQSDHSLIQVSDQVAKISANWTLETHCFNQEGECSEVFSWESVDVSLLEDVVAFNGYKLRRREVKHLPRILPPIIADIWEWISPSCENFRSKVTYRTHPYYTEYSYQSSDPYDVTMVTQLSFDRLHALQQLIDNWDGPMSIAVYLNDNQIYDFLRFMHSSSAARRHNVAVTIVYKEGALYPINYLRNVAWNNSNTPYVFLNDVDLMTGPHVYRQIKQSLNNVHGNMEPRHSKIAYVVPSFQTFSQNLPFPEDKQVLEELLRKEIVVPLKWKSMQIAHKPTNYAKWRTSNSIYTVKWKLRYEPYIVVHRDSSMYDERFAGYGWNKVSQIEELHAQRYAFVVLPDVFVIHYPHPASKEEVKFRGASSRNANAKNTVNYWCIRLLKDEFEEDLKKKYTTSY